MAKIIALQGRASCGKTETMHFLRDEIIKKYNIPTSAQHLLPKRKSKDFAIWLTGVNNLTIGIVSEGDPNSFLRKDVQELLNCGCDIIFCACRTSGMTVDWLKSFTPAHSLHFEAKRIVQGNFANENLAQAKDLMRLAGI